MNKIEIKCCHCGQVFTKTTNNDPENRLADVIELINENFKSHSC